MPVEPKYLPTPAEIREACKKLQATWSDREFRKRAGVVDGKVPIFTVPRAHTPSQEPSVFSGG